MSDEAITALQKTISAIRGQKREALWRLEETSRTLIRSGFIPVTPENMRVTEQMQEKKAREKMAFLLSGRQEPFQLRLGDSHYQFQIKSGEVVLIVSGRSPEVIVWRIDPATLKWVKRDPPQFWEDEDIASVLSLAIAAAIAHKAEESQESPPPAFEGKPKFWGLMLNLPDAVRDARK